MPNTLETKTETIEIIQNGKLVAQAVLSGNGKISNVSQSNFLLNGTYPESFETIKHMAEKRAYKDYGENIEIKYSPTQ